MSTRDEPESSWRIFGSARDLFTSARNWKLTEKRAEISILSWRPIFYYSIRKLTKLFIWIKLFTFKNTKVQINDHKIDWNHDTGLLIIKTWGKNELKKFRFSSVSAHHYRLDQLIPCLIVPSSVVPSQMVPNCIFPL